MTVSLFFYLFIFFTKRESSHRTIISAIPFIIIVKFDNFIICTRICVDFFSILNDLVYVTKMSNHKSFYCIYNIYTQSFWKTIISFHICLDIFHQSIYMLDNRTYGLFAMYVHYAGFWTWFHSKISFTN